MVGAKRRKVSKNKKKNWKYSDIKDVEEYLDNVRLQERTGGIVSEKKDSELFVIDKSATDLSSLRRNKKFPKQLKCHALLLPDANIKAAAVVREAKKVDPAKKKQDLILEKKVAAKKQKAKGKVAGKKLKKTYDLWNDDSRLKDKESEKIDVIDEGHFSVITKRRRVNAPPKYLDKPYTKPAVEVPHAGMSYNPTFEDHQELLQDAVAVEVAKERAEMKITRALDQQFPSKAEAPTEQSYLKEMSAGLKDAESDPEEESGEEMDMDQLPVARAVKNTKKTTTQRNREKRQKEMEAIKKKKKALNVKTNEFYRLRSIKKELSTAEEELIQRQYKEALKKKNRIEGTHRLGFKRFEVPDLEVKLSDEMEGTLRLLKPEGSLFDDRFKSFQKRNVIEPRLRAKNLSKRKFKKKTFEKKAHKAVTI